MQALRQGQRFGRLIRVNPLNDLEALEPLLANYAGPDEVEGLDTNVGF